MDCTGILFSESSQRTQMSELKQMSNLTKRKILVCTGHENALLIQANFYSLLTQS